MLNIRSLNTCVLFLLLSVSVPVPAADKPGSAPARPPARVVLGPVTGIDWHPASRLQGVLRFARVADVAAEVEGVVTQVSFEAGQRLQKGTELLRLDTAFIEKDIAIARSEGRELDADIEKLAREVERLTRLKRDNNTSRSAYDEAYYTHKALKQRRKTLLQRIARLQLSLDKSHIRAPFDGVVLMRGKEVGDWVTKGESIARLGAVDFMFIDVPVAEGLVRFQSVDSQYQVHLPALAQPVQAGFETIVPVADVRSRTVTLRLRVPWSAGMIENASAEVDVSNAASRKLTKIPRAALLQSASGSTVYTVKDGKAVALPVHIVARDADGIIVDSEAIDVGMQVVVEGNDRLKPGQAIQPIDAP